MFSFLPFLLLLLWDVSNFAEWKPDAKRLHFTVLRIVTGFHKAPFKKCLLELNQKSYDIFTKKRSNSSIQFSYFFWYELHGFIINNNYFLDFYFYK